MCGGSCNAAIGTYGRVSSSSSAPDTKQILIIILSVSSNCMPACIYDTSNTIRIVFLRSQPFEVNLSLGACGKIVIQLFSNYDRQIVLKFSASAVPVHMLYQKMTLEKLVFCKYLQNDMKSKLHFGVQWAPGERLYIYAAEKCTYSGIFLISATRGTKRL